MKICLKNFNGKLVFTTDNNHILLGHHSELFRIPRGSHIKILNESLLREKILSYFSIRDIQESRYRELLEYLNKQKGKSHVNK